MQIDGSGRVQLVPSVPVLRPDEQVLQLMLDGWRNQQLSRNLQFAYSTNGRYRRATAATPPAAEPATRSQHRCQTTPTNWAPTPTPSWSASA